MDSGECDPPLYHGAREPRESKGGGWWGAAPLTYYISSPRTFPQIPTYIYLVAYAVTYCNVQHILNGRKNKNGGIDVDTTENRRGLRHLSLCSGYDGIGLGLERAGIDIEFTVHVEIEAFANWNLVTKIEASGLGTGVVYPDLKTFPFGKFRGCFDILSGGFPCQPFSQAGKGAGDEDPRHLFPYIRDGIKACSPAVVFLENVEGIVSAKLKGDHWRDPAGTPVLLHVIRELERLGYRATAVPTSASEVGAPHQRNRWFIIGVADREGEGLEGYDGLFSGRDESRRITEEQEGPFGRRNRGGTLWPSRPGEAQHGWEPPRVVANAEERGNGQHPPEREGGEVSGGTSSGVGNAPSNDELRQAKPPLGGNLNRTSGGMDYAELCESGDNRTDELRLLGNGVVPQSACDAFRRGMRSLMADPCGV